MIESTRFAVIENIRAIPFYIHTPPPHPPVDEVSQNLPPKKKDQSDDLMPPSEKPDFLKPIRKKTTFCSFFTYPLRKNQRCQHILDLLRKDRQRGVGGGVNFLWNGPNSLVL